MERKVKLLFELSNWLTVIHRVYVSLEERNWMHAILNWQTVNICNWIENNKTRAHCVPISISESNIGLYEWQYTRFSQTFQTLFGLNLPTKHSLSTYSIQNDWMRLRQITNYNKLRITPNSIDFFYFKYVLHSKDALPIRFLHVFYENSKQTWGFYYIDQTLCGFITVYICCTKMGI